MFCLFRNYLIRSVQPAVRPKNLLEVNMQRQRSTPKENPKNSRRGPGFANYPDLVILRGFFCFRLQRLGPKKYTKLITLVHCHISAR